MSKDDIRQGLKSIFRRPSHRNLYPWLIERALHYGFIGVMAMITKEWFAVLVAIAVATLIYCYEFVAKGR